MLSSPSTHSLKSVHARALAERHGLIYYLGWALVFVVLAWAWNGAEIRPLGLINDSQNMATYAKDFFPPDFKDWKLYVKEMLVTIQIAIWGTLLAIVFAVPFGLLSSSNIVKPWVYQPVRRLMDAFRAINEMVFALLFIVAVGLGPFAGVMALFVHTTGTLAKLFSEAVEAVDRRPVEGIRVTGSHPIAEIIFGIIPQVLPLWVSYILYRFESNVRSASVVGMVGAGGIGVVLFEVIRGFEYQQTCAVLIILVVAVSIIDVISSYLRRFVS
ncbi:MAG: phosphonate ABC transporter, permease protein PhnE [Betaproteobacteria bacterium]|jgi:phosphonate transport system permease protein|nr:phosphonate ABC transporter, permease protein PhnE [Betaproteobacteria bacterium]